MHIAPSSFLIRRSSSSLVEKTLSQDYISKPNLHQDADTKGSFATSQISLIVIQKKSEIQLMGIFQKCTLCPCAVSNPTGSRGTMQNISVRLGCLETEITKFSLSMQIGPVSVSQRCTFANTDRFRQGSWAAHFQCSSMPSYQTVRICVVTWAGRFLGLRHCICGLSG